MNDEYAGDCRGYRRALLLLSGGLDSQLAACVLKDQGVNMHGIVFVSPFFDSRNALKAADRLCIPIHEQDVTVDMLKLLQNPAHGFGSNMNPCIDCHILMLRKAGELMGGLGCDFIATGEVLDQRPMSQNANMLKLIARESGYGNLIVRPLSARLLPETDPEHNGWIDREKLPAISGRSRDVQFRLAEQYGLRDFPTPAGGCRLTDPNFARRLLDLKEHEGLNDTRAIFLLRVGRHFRLGPNVKLVMGRHEQDNVQIEGNAELYDLTLKVEDIPSPTGLLPFTALEEQIQLSAAICARYSDCAAGEPVTVRIRSARGVRRIKTVSADPHDIEKLRI